MFDKLSIHHFGIVIPKRNQLKIEKSLKKKFKFDFIQGTKVLFIKPFQCEFYIEYILKMGRVKNAKTGFHHFCYNVKNPKQIKNILKNYGRVIELTKIEKSASKECNYVQFFYFPNLGIIEFNIKSV